MTAQHRRISFGHSIATNLIYSVVLGVTLCMALGGILRAENPPPGLPTGQVLGRTLLTDYFDLLTSGNYESAEYLWAPQTLERATRFGNTFTGIPVKADAASPIVRDVIGMSDFLQPPARQFEMLAVDSFVRMRFENLANGRIAKHFYYAQIIGTSAWLVAPQDYYARHWPVQESRFFRLHVDSSASRFLNSQTLALADRQVAALADSLLLTPAQKTLLEQKKIEFYFCGSDSMVTAMTGAQTRGLLDLGTNDLISATFPHDHEVLHLLANIKFGAIPLYTLPLIREGMAVYYGGRWSKSASALNDLGVYLHRENLASIDSILTMSEFDEVGADLAYPVAGLFFGFIREKAGVDGALKIYRQLSGDFKTVYGYSPDTVRQIIATALKSTNWAAVLAGFETYCQEQITTRASAQPGVGKGSSLLKQDQWTLTKDKTWISTTFQGTPGSPAKGSLFFVPDPKLKGSSSEQLDVQFGAGTLNEGFRYLIRVDQFEAGLYDLGTGQLTAKYIWGISPSGDFADTTSGTITVKFRTSLFDPAALKNPAPAITRPE